MPRVLVTDDEPNLLEMIQDFCEMIDLEAIPAENGEQCLEKAVSEKPDVITVDMRMPGLTGLEVITKLKENDSTKSIPVFLCTADGKLHEEEALKLGAAGVIPKPITRASLKEALEKAIGEWE